MASENNKTNYTRAVKCDKIIAEEIKIGTTLISNGTITNLQNPILENDAATKQYIDNFVDTDGVSFPVESIQVNTGTKFIGTSKLTYDEDKLFINNTLKIGNLTIKDNRLTNIKNPVTKNGATTYSYLYKYSNVFLLRLQTTENSYNLMPQQVINRYIVRTVNNNQNIIQDVLPNIDKLYEYVENVYETFSFDLNYTFTGPGSRILLFGNIVPRGNFDNINNPIELVTVPKDTTIHLVGTIVKNQEDALELVYYVKHIQSFYSSSVISDKGITVPHFSSSRRDNIVSSFIIQPLVLSTLNGSDSKIYTKNILDGKLIIRNTNEVDVEDTFESVAAIYVPGYVDGMTKFVVQNVNTSTGNILVGGSIPPSGWIYEGTRTVPPGKNGIFYIEYNFEENKIYLYTVAIVDRNG